MGRVPTITDVIPGAGVNIVLKADQGTGRTVSGTVLNVLTRGNHPRGIKVRLSDGRVGRVQTMANDLSQGARSPPLMGVNDEKVPLESWVEGSSRRDRWKRQDETEQPPRQQVGLDAYIKPAKQKGKGKHKGVTPSVEAGDQPPPIGEDDMLVRQSTPSVLSNTVTCPICGEFEGDEAAVTHHVSTHFDL